MSFTTIKIAFSFYHFLFSINPAIRPFLFFAAKKARSQFSVERGRLMIKSSFTPVIKNENKFGRLEDKLQMTVKSSIET